MILVAEALPVAETLEATRFSSLEATLKGLQPLSYLQTPHSQD